MIEKIRQYVEDNEFRLTIFKDRVHIINYLEILSLDGERMSFSTDSFRIVIKGNNLVVNKLLDKEVLIFGTILGVEVNYD